jgi:hypothetical protein
MLTAALAERIDASSWFPDEHRPDLLADERAKALSHRVIREHVNQMRGLRQGPVSRGLSALWAW